MKVNICFMYNKASYYNMCNIACNVCKDCILSKTKIKKYNNFASYASFKSNCYSVCMCKLKYGSQRNNSVHLFPLVHVGTILIWKQK